MCRATPGLLSLLGVDGRGILLCLSFPLSAEPEEAPKVSEDNFLAPRGASRESQEGLGPGPEKCQVFEAGRSGDRGQRPAVGTSDQEVGSAGKRGRLVAPDGGTWAPWGVAGHPKERCQKDARRSFLQGFMVKRELGYEQTAAPPPAPPADVGEIPAWPVLRLWPFGTPSCWPLPAVGS